MSLCDILDLGIFLIRFIFGNRDFHGEISSNFERLLIGSIIILNIVDLSRETIKSDYYN
jgi:hypothetical protein